MNFDNSKAVDSKIMFRLRKSRFEVKSHSVENLLAEKVELMERLEMSKTEIDNCINYIHKLSTDKNNLSQCINDFKLSSDILLMQKTRLENHNKVLEKECKDLLALICKLGPKELYNKDEWKQEDAELILDQIKNSVKLMFTDRAKLMNENEELIDQLNLMKENQKFSKKEMMLISDKLTNLENISAKITFFDRSKISSQTTADKKRLGARFNSVDSKEIPRCILDRYEFSKENNYRKTIDSDDDVIKNRPNNNHQVVIKKVEQHVDKLTNNKIITALREIKGLSNVAMTFFSGKGTFEVIEEDSMDDGDLKWESVEKVTQEIVKNLEEANKHIVELNSQKEELENENKTLNSELESFKYALTVRMEIKNARNPNVILIDEQKRKIEELETQVGDYLAQISDLDAELEKSREERSQLFLLLSNFTNDQ